MSLEALDNFLLASIAIIPMHMTYFFSLDAFTV